jgi:hypothetical protein
MVWDETTRWPELGYCLAGIGGLGDAKKRQALHTWMTSRKWQEQISNDKKQISNVK